MAPSNFEENDKGYDDFVESFLDTNDVTVTIGVHSQDNEQAGEDSEISLAELLRVHEFGANIKHPGGTPYVMTDSGPRFVEKGHPNAVGVTSPHTIPIPPRPVLRRGIGDNDDEISELSARELGDALEGRQSVHQAMNRIGIHAKGLVQAMFGSSKLAPNAPSTVRRKGSGSPLIDDGILRGAIDYEVHGTD